MEIPQGLDFTFKVTIIEQDSFTPQDLTNMDMINSSFTISTLSTLCSIEEGTAILEVINAIEGIITVTLDSTLTSSLVYERGDKVDNYYRKPTHQGILTIKFTDGTPDRIAVIGDIYIIPTGASCA